MICRNGIASLGIAAVYVALAATAFCAHPVVGGGAGKSGAPVTTATGTTMGEGQWGLALQMDMVNFDNYSETRLEQFASDDREIHDTDMITSYSLLVSRGITDHITASIGLPYITKTDIRESEPPDEVHGHGNSKGLGDIAIYATHMAIHLPDDGFHLAITYGLKIPTGETDVKDRNGEQFETEFQPGTGSWDPLLGVAVTEDYGPFSFHGNVHFTLVTEGSRNTDLGDRLAYNIAAVYRTPPPIRMKLLLEANGLWQDKEKINGVKDPDSGGSLILLSPGLRVSITPAMDAYASFGFPIYQELNGDQNEIDYRLVTGLSMAF